MTSPRELQLSVDDLSRALPRVVAVLTHRVGGVQQLDARCEAGRAGSITVVVDDSRAPRTIDQLALQLRRIVGVTSVRGPRLGLEDGRAV